MAKPTIIAISSGLNKGPLTTRIVTLPLQVPDVNGQFIDRNASL